MKMNISHAVVLDDPLCLLSLLWRMTKTAWLIPQSRHFIFVQATNGLHNAKFSHFKSVLSLSTAKGNEQVPFAFVDLRDAETLQRVSENQIELSKINLIAFSSISDVLLCFQLQECDLFFLAADHNILVNLVDSGCVITPSIAMSKSACDLFFDKSIPFQYAEYFREDLFCRGVPDTKIHMRTFVLQETNQPTYNKENIDKILQQSFGNSNDFEDRKKNKSK